MFISPGSKNIETQRPTGNSGNGKLNLPLMAAFLMLGTVVVWMVWFGSKAADKAVEDAKHPPKKVENKQPEDTKISNASTEQKEKDWEYWMTAGKKACKISDF